MAKSIVGPLLNEVEQRCKEAEEAAVQLTEGMWNARVKQASAHESDVVGNPKRERERQVAEESFKNVTEIRKRIHDCLGEFVGVFKGHDDGVGLLQEGKAELVELVRLVNGHETLHRSKKLAKTLQIGQ